MKIISNSKWKSIDMQIKSLRSQISDLCEENISKDNEIDEIKRNLKDKTKEIENNEKIYEELLDSNRQLSKQILDLEQLKAENKRLKTLCSKNKIDYKKNGKKK